MVLVDTDILVDVLRGRDDAAKMLDELAASKLSTSVVSRMELIADCRNKDDLGRVARLLGTF